MGYLEAQGLISGYQENIVLKGISFSVDKGEFIGIIGPNGAGKTTLLKTLTHIIKPKSGKVYFKGKDIHRMAGVEAAQRFAMVGQGLISIFSFSVKEVVLMGRTPYIGIFGSETKKDIEICDEVLRLTGLEGLKERPIDCLSAGERQRVLIARALTQMPEVLLMDEPTAHLDIGRQIEILDLVVSLMKKRRFSVVCVLHDLNLASQYCDRILLIASGKAAAFAPPKDILKEGLIEKAFSAPVVINEKAFSGRPSVLPISRKL